MLFIQTTVKVPLIGSQDFWDSSKEKSDLHLLNAIKNEKPAEKRDAEIISNIDEVYFNNSDFDFARFELEVGIKLFYTTYYIYNLLVQILRWHMHVTKLTILYL